jgi:hypothetical protein
MPGMGGATMRGERGEGCGEAEEWCLREGAGRGIAEDKIAPFGTVVGYSM